MMLSDELYDKYIKLIYKRTGLYYESNKKYFVEKRIIQHTESLQIDSLNEYYMLLKFGTDSSEFYQLINDLTINETYFFRDFPQLRNFAEDVLPIVEKRKMSRKKIKIWCAACSTGEEPYTLSIILQEMLDEPEKWDIQIIASDINSEVLQSAKTGLYDSRAIKDVPIEYLEKYFKKRQDKYLINLNIRKSVSFFRINLMDTMSRSSINGCDFIFCRNCLIYFDEQSRKSVVMSFYESLNLEGFLFLGHSESVGRITSLYKAKKIGDTIVYSKSK
ncbi:chemotaxis protein [Acetobacterium tundrae]|uniref:protein-glutamate O-methyltransferase n=1 Tax=Acetobacterium tundrae TaxID=132932 RepID=A0ABR6WMF9_9FIRM|nr:chemotaxis protein [Acetobacterium tundrae]